MIRQQNGQYHVLSEDGKKRLGSYKTYGEAVKRLQQIEYFKNKAKNGK